MENMTPESSKRVAFPLQPVNRLSLHPRATLSSHRAKSHVWTRALSPFLRGEDPQSCNPMPDPQCVCRISHSLYRLSHTHQPHCSSSNAWHFRLDPTSSAANVKLVPQDHREFTLLETAHAAIEFLDVHINWSLSNGLLSAKPFV